MYLLLGNWHLDSGDYERAAQALENSRAQLEDRMSRPPSVVSLVNLLPLLRGALKSIFGRYLDGSLTISALRFDSDFEAFYAAGCAREAREAILVTVNTLSDEVLMTAPVANWVTGEFIFYLFYCHPFFVLLQISCNDASPLPKAVITQAGKPPITTVNRWFVRLPLHHSHRPC